MYMKFNVVWRMLHCGDAVSVSNFWPFEGVGGPIGPIFWVQVIWSLAPIALMQKKPGQIGVIGPCGRKTGQKLASTIDA